MKEVYEIVLSGTKIVEPQFRRKNQNREGKHEEKIAKIIQNLKRKHMVKVTVVYLHHFFII